MSFLETLLEGSAFDALGNWIRQKGGVQLSSVATEASVNSVGILDLGQSFQNCLE